VIVANQNQVLPRHPIDRFVTVNLDRFVTVNLDRFVTVNEPER
jgi:hypothetical protein